MYRSPEEIVKEMAPWLKKLYRGDKAGCCLHAIVDDFNWDLQFEPDDCVVCGGKCRHKACRKVSELLAEMELEDRWRLDHKCGKELRLRDEYEGGCCPHCGQEYND